MARAMKNAIHSGPRKVTMAGIEWTEQYGYYRAMLNGWMELQLQPEVAKLVVVEDRVDVVLLCNDREAENAKSQGRAPIGVGFRRRHIVDPLRQIGVPCGEVDTDIQPPTNFQTVAYFPDGDK